MNHIHDLLKSLFIMSSMVEARDPYTGGHLWRVSQFSRMLAEQVGLEKNDVARVALGGFLHDLGKIGVSESILNKPDRLTGDEYEVIKTHPDVGSRLLSDHPLAELVRTSVLSHHETPDGSGYPNHLSGKALHMDARIVGICDAFDAMTSTRPYRKGMLIENALTIINDNLGRQFDEYFGKHFLELGESGALQHIVGHSEPGIPLQMCPICGPTIVVTKNLRTGNSVYCRNCGAEAVVIRKGDEFRIAPTGKRGMPADLEPDMNDDLITSLVEESGRFVHVGKKRGESFFSRIFNQIRA
jgi:hypothetical protein